MNVNIPPAISEMGPVLSEFFESMVHKLNVNSHKDAIRGDDIDGLLAKMEDEIREFREQRIADAEDPNVLEELADVANFAFLLYAYMRARGVRDVKERFIDEYLDIQPMEGRVFCRKTRSGSPLRVGDEVKGSWRKGRCFIRMQHAESGMAMSVPRSDLIYWYMTGKWPIGPMRYVNGDKSDDRYDNLDMVSPLPEKRFPFVSQYKPKGKETGANYGKYVYQRRHAFRLVRVGYWDTPEEAAREGLKAWKRKIQNV